MQRKIDHLRRILIPINLFKELEFSERQKVELSIEYGELFIRKFQEENWQTRPFVGLVRSIDALHRVVIPAEYLQLLEITPGDIVNLELKESSIKISKP